VTFGFQKSQSKLGISVSVLSLLSVSSQTCWEVTPSLVYNCVSYVPSIDIHIYCSIFSTLWPIQV